MDVNKLSIPVATVVSIVMAAIAGYSWVASKGYVNERQRPLQDAVESIGNNIQIQTQLVEQNAKNSSRALSLTIAKDISNMLNRLCYEDLDAETRRRALEVVDRWMGEYEELTGRAYVPGECDQ